MKISDANIRWFGANSKRLTDFFVRLLRLKAWFATIGRNGSQSCRAFYKTN